MVPHSLHHIHTFTFTQQHSCCSIFPHLSHCCIAEAAPTLQHLCSTSHVAAFMQHLTHSSISVAAFALPLSPDSIFAVHTSDSELSALQHLRCRSCAAALHVDKDYSERILPTLSTTPASWSRGRDCQGGGVLGQRRGGCILGWAIFEMGCFGLGWGWWWWCIPTHPSRVG